VLTPEFQRFSEVFFGPDRFHPSATGYARMAAVVLPTVLAALDLAPEDAAPEYERGDALLPLDLAVVEAVRHPGASIEPVAADEAPPAGRFGRFVLLRRRRRQPEPEVESPAAQEPVS
jgi:hypothetical protein